MQYAPHVNAVWSFYMAAFKLEVVNHLPVQWRS